MKIRVIRGRPLQQVAYTRVHAQQQGLSAANKQASIFAKIVHLPHIQAHKCLNTIIFETECI